MGKSKPRSFVRLSRTIGCVPLWCVRWQSRSVFRSRLISNNVPMGFAALLMLALGLAMDATAAAATRGLIASAVGARDVATIALLFGGAQAAMPAVGWAFGSAIGPLAGGFVHGIAFVVLVGLGAKMVWQARPNAAAEDNDEPSDPFEWRLLVTMAVATSIDAFAVGVTLPMLKAPMTLSLVTIGVTTAVCSGVAVVVGHRLRSAVGKERVGKKFEFLGGVVLIVLGTKILIDHLTA